MRARPKKRLRRLFGLYDRRPVGDLATGTVSKTQDGTICRPAAVFCYVRLCSLRRTRRLVEDHRYEEDTRMADMRIIVGVTVFVVVVVLTVFGKWYVIMDANSMCTHPMKPTN